MFPKNTLSKPLSPRFGKISATVITAGLLAGLLTGCSVAANNGTPAPGDSNSPSASVVYDTAPLTGIQYPQGTNSFLAGPVVMGKIDNAPDARPQLGLSKADIVIDEMVEGGLTRFLAIWHSRQPDQFGPIRSVRPMDPDLATAFGGIISYSGGQRPFVAAMQATGIYNATETSEQSHKTMVRVTDRVAPHNLFVKAKDLQSQHMALGAPKPPFSFSPDLASSTASIFGKDNVESVTAQFPAATAVWTWNGKKFARTQDGKVHTDALDGKQLTADNVLVLRVAVDRSFRDPRYGFVPKTLLEGTGKGTVFSNGKSLDVTWTKTSASQYVVLTDSNGNVIKLAPGNTWFELVPTDVGKVTVKYATVIQDGASPSATPKK
jgi:hypothetical protein